MIVIHNGGLIDSLELHDPDLADIEVQVLAWLRVLLDEDRELVEEGMHKWDICTSGSNPHLHE